MRFTLGARVQFQTSLYIELTLKKCCWAADATVGEASPSLVGVDVAIEAAIGEKGDFSDEDATSSSVSSRTFI